MIPDPIVELSGVTIRYGNQSILAGLDLQIAKGSFIALVGPSGSGKTTLLKTINGLVSPNDGRVHINGRNIAETPPAELRRGIGYAFQGIGLFPHMTVAENIGIVPRLSGWSEQERDARVSELVEMVDLPRTVLPRFPASLSGGQAQRIGFARALAARPAIMLMDEPFGALDPVIRDEISRAYRSLHDTLGLTTVMVTHDMTEALLLADRIVVLIGGGVRADGPPASLMAGHTDEEVAKLITVPRRQAERLAELRGVQ